MTKSSVAVLKDARKLGYVIQDFEPPESSSVLTEEHKGTNSTSAF